MKSFLVLIVLIVTLAVQVVFAGVRYREVGSGRGTSSSFTESSCLFCTQYRSQAKSNARAQAEYVLRSRCEEKGAVLVESPSFEDESCTKIKGWYSYYYCVVRAVGTCERF